MAFGSSGSSRRDFVKQGLGAGLGLAGAAAGGEAIAGALAGDPPTSLSPVEIAAVRALMARLIPADAAGGGAVEAGADIFLDRALAAFHAQHLETYRAALAGLDQVAKRQGHASVAAMPAAALDALITQMEQGELTGTALADGGRVFFNLIRRHTIEGFLSDPVYGGNRDFIGWQAIGYSGVQLWYPAEAQALNGTDDRPQRSIGDFGGTPLA